MYYLSHPSYDTLFIAVLANKYIIMLLKDWMEYHQIQFKELRVFASEKQDMTVETRDCIVFLREDFIELISFFNYVYLQLW